MGMASSTGCVGGSPTEPFSRLLIRPAAIQAGEKQHHLHMRSDKVQKTEEQKEIMIAEMSGSRRDHNCSSLPRLIPKPKRVGDTLVSSLDDLKTGYIPPMAVMMMGDPSSTAYRFLDAKTSRHLGTFVRVPPDNLHGSFFVGVDHDGTHDQKFAMFQDAFQACQAAKSVKTFYRDREGSEPSADRWELVLEPQSGIALSIPDLSHSNSTSFSTLTHEIRRSPEALIAACVVAQMMVSRPDLITPTKRGLGDKEIGQKLGRKVDRLLSNFS